MQVTRWLGSTGEFRHGQAETFKGVCGDMQKFLEVERSVAGSREFPHEKISNRNEIPNALRCHCPLRYHPAAARYLPDHGTSCMVAPRPQCNSVIQEGEERAARGEGSRAPKESDTSQQCRHQR